MKFFIPIFFGKDKVEKINYPNYLLNYFIDYQLVKLKIENKNSCPQTSADPFLYQMTVSHQITFQNYISLFSFIM